MEACHHWQPKWYHEAFEYIGDGRNDEMERNSPKKPVSGRIGWGTLHDSTPYRYSYLNIRKAAEYSDLDLPMVMGLTFVHSSFDVSRPLILVPDLALLSDCRAFMPDPILAVLAVIVPS